MSGIGGIFEPFYNYVVKQLQRRKEALGAIGAKGHRHPNFHALTTKTCTIRMSSGVDIINSVDNQGNFKYDGLDGISLARRFVLEGTPTAVRAKRGEDGSIAGVKTGTGVLSNEEKVKNSTNILATTSLTFPWKVLNKGLIVFCIASAETKCAT